MLDRDLELMLARETLWNAWRRLRSTEGNEEAMELLMTHAVAVNNEYQECVRERW
jgi:hypothetical protein